MKSKEINLKDKSKCTLKLLDETNKEEFTHYLQTIPFYFSDGILLDEADLKNFAFSDFNEYIIAIINSQIIGHITISFPKYKFGYHQEHIIEAHINVQQEWQQKGVGDGLLAFLINFAREKKMKKIKTKMLANNLGAIRLFEKHGFEQEGFLKKEWKLLVKGKEEFVDGMHMARLL